MTKEGFLSLLTAAYTGSASVEEGSFAGDVLRACADGMAQLWSMEIDGLEYRAFVSTATGAWLTDVCADRGVLRREGESDEMLRQRTMAILAANPASGNADHYEKWCTQVDGILRVKVFPLARGNGSVDIVAVNTNGKCPEESLLAQAQAIVDAERPVGVDARVLGAVETAVDVAATVTLAEYGDLESVREAFASDLADFCRQVALRTNTVSYARILGLLLDCESVEDVSGFTLCGKDESIVLPEGSVPVCGTVLLEAAQ